MPNKTEPIINKIINTDMKYMPNLLTLAIFSLLTFNACHQEQKEKRLIQYVDPFVGTAYTGHTTPAAAYPLGFMQPGPQSGNFGWEHCSGYNYEDSLIWGFTQNKLNGTGIPDMGDILMMPFSGIPTRSDYKSSALKEKEIASPGYYSVELPDNHVNVELTCTPHVALHRYSFKDENPGVYIDFQSGSVSTEEQYNNRVLDANVVVDDDYTITGYHKLKGWVERQLFYIIKFDQPIVSQETIPGNIGNKAPMKIFYFKLKKGQPLLAKVAFSTVSIDNAKENMMSEISHWDFEQIKSDTENAWEDLLTRIQIEGTEDQKKNFYTSMYH